MHRYMQEDDEKVSGGMWRGSMSVNTIASGAAAIYICYLLLIVFILCGGGGGPWWSCVRVRSVSSPCSVLVLGLRPGLLRLPFALAAHSLMLAPAAFLRSSRRVVAEVEARRTRRLHSRKSAGSAAQAPAASSS